MPLASMLVYVNAFVDIIINMTTSGDLHCHSMSSVCPNVKLQAKQYDVSSIDKNINYTLNVEPDFNNSYSNSTF